jgi:UDP-2-acetamido-3-amino-2,3-dideoxy-glucuronate N-acetyltransferase
MTVPRIACIGAGAWGVNLVRNFYELGALHCVCELDARRQRDVSAKYTSVPFVSSVEHVLGDQKIDAVAIATPAVTHGDLAKQALLAGKDVFVEKPLCLSFDQGRELVMVAARERRILMVGHLLWYHPAIIALKELIERGELGRIQYIYSHRLNLGRIRREENILWSFAPHDLSVILGLVGELPNEVQAQGGNYLHPRIADVTVSMLAFPSGVRAHIFVSWLHPFKEQKLIVVGDRQMAVFDDLEENENKLRLYPHSIEWKNRLPVINRAESKSVSTELVEPLRAECQHFLECIQTRRQPRTDGEEGLRVLGVLQKCEEALQSREHGSIVQSPRNFTAHESAFIDEDVVIGEGTTIWHVSHVLRGCRIGKNCRIGQNVVIGPNVVIGNGVKIQNNVSVYEGVTLEDHVFCGPSMVFTNVYNPRSEIIRKDEYRQTLIRKGATLGANCTILCGVTIGQYAFVGAGAVVLKDIPDFALVVGNPGRLAGWMCVCGNRIEFAGNSASGPCESCRREYVCRTGVVSLK